MNVCNIAATKCCIDNITNHSGISLKDDCELGTLGKIVCALLAISVTLAFVALAIYIII